MYTSGNKSHPNSFNCSNDDNCPASISIVNCNNPLVFVSNNLLAAAYKEDLLLNDNSWTVVTLFTRSIFPSSLASKLGKYKVYSSISKSLPVFAINSCGTIIVPPMFIGKNPAILMASIEFKPSVGIPNPIISKASELKFDKSKSWP